jgi:hypothetical protein
MIAPIGSNDQSMSPYDRYAQYQQYLKPDGQRVAHPRAVPPVGEMQKQSPMPGQTGAPFVAAPTANAQLPGAPAQGEGAVPANAIRGPGVAEDIAKTAEKECRTCAERKYQDRSNDSGVSFQTPTSIHPDQAGAAVLAHEQEHVVREQAKAQREGREVVHQSVSIQTAICPECGRIFVSGGTTTTVTRAKKEDDMFQAGQNTGGDGRFLNTLA